MKGDRFTGAAPHGVSGLNGLPDPRLSAMRSDVPLSAWPPATDDRRAVLAAMCWQFDRSQWLSMDEIRARQFAQLAAVAVHHARHTPAFGHRLEDAGLVAEDLASADGLARLGLLSRRALQTEHHLAEEKTLPGKHGPLGQVSTSGSTGEPVKVVRTAVNKLHWLAHTVRYHLWGEPEGFERLAVVRANLASHGVRPDWAAPMALMWATGPMLAIDIEADIDSQIDQLAAFAPASVILYPSNLAALLDRMAVRGVALPSVSRWRTLGETLTQDLRERITSQTDASVSDCYSSEELGYIAIQCPDDPTLYHQCAETLILELVDDDGLPVPEGEVGRVVATDLHNLATPLVRYDIGDYAVAGPPCACGRGLPTLRRMMGRTRNMIVKPDGTRHWPLTGYKQFRDIAPITQYQFRQHRVDAIEVRLVTERPLTAAEEQALTDHLHWKLRHPFEIELTYFDGRLPLGNNGKFEEFLSLL